MKVRAGFVSNSSSSSFVVAFPKTMPLTVEAVKEYLFDDQEYIDYWDEGLSTDLAAEIILEDIKSQIAQTDEAKADEKKNSYSIISESCSGAPEFDYERYWSMSQTEKDSYSNDFDIKLESFIQSVMKGFSDLEKTHNLFNFEFSDNDGSAQCALEHGGTFNRVKHWSRSNH